MGEKSFIQDFAFFASLVVSMIGIGVFYGPAIVAKYVGADTWVSALITGALIFIVLYLIYMLIKANDFKGIVGILTNSYGKVIGKIISLIYAIMMILALSLSLRMFSEVISMYLLVNTPTEIILITFIFMGVYLSRGGLANVVHFNEIAFWVMFIPITIVLILTIPIADFSNLLPTFTAGIKSYFMSSFELVFLLNGFSMAFILIPHVKKKHRIKRMLGGSSLFVAIFYAITFILVTSTLSVGQTVDSIFPTINMLQSITSKSGFLERWDSLVMSMWVIFYFTSFANIYYFASYICKEVFNVEEIRISSIIFIPLVYVAALFPESIIDVRDLKLRWLRIGFIASIIVVILITFIVSYIKRKRGGAISEG